MGPETTVYLGMAFFATMFGGLILRKTWRLFGLYQEFKTELGFQTRLKCSASLIVSVLVVSFFICIGLCMALVSFVNMAEYQLLTLL